mmetsp:Transcript_6356/g.22690  ORF Transcript_6356/g.22690 Transcript_6356/m.22690 type:complete len:209 (+) Transcript_6356:797-1423(+)
MHARDVAQMDGGPHEPAEGFADDGGAQRRSHRVCEREADGDAQRRQQHADSELRAADVVAVHDRRGAAHAHGPRHEEEDAADDVAVARTLGHVLDKVGGQADGRGRHHRRRVVAEHGRRVRRRQVADELHGHGGRHLALARVEQDGEREEHAKERGRLDVPRVRVVTLAAPRREAAAEVAGARAEREAEAHRERDHEGVEHAGGAGDG